MSHSPANKGTVQAASGNNGVEHTQAKVGVSRDKQAGATQRKARLSGGNWVDMTRKREEFFRDNWADVTQQEDQQLMKLPFTELHRQSLQNPDSMANVTKVSTL